MLFFVATALSGIELWKSNDTSAGMELVPDINL